MILNDGFGMIEGATFADEIFEDGEEACGRIFSIVSAEQGVAGGVGEMPALVEGERGLNENAVLRAGAAMQE